MPTSEELAFHWKDDKRFEAAQQLRRVASDLLNTASDGWVPTEVFEETKAKHRELLSAMLTHILEDKDLDDDEPIKTEEDLREL